MWFEDKHQKDIVRAIISRHEGNQFFFLIGRKAGTSGSGKGTTTFKSNEYDPSRFYDELDDGDDKGDDCGVIYDRVGDDGRDIPSMDDEHHCKMGAQMTSGPRVSDSHIGDYRISDSRGNVNGGRGRRRRNRGGRKERARKERRLLSTAVLSPHSPLSPPRVRPHPPPSFPSPH